MPPSLELIDLDQQSLTGYRRFISCWLSRGEGPTFVVDPGPASTAAYLLTRLREIGVGTLDFILLTHIHLDHGGATAALLAAYPEARVVCHDRARDHLAAPARLWEGSHQVLGTVAETYGEPAPVAPASLASHTEASEAGIETIPTPGHAPHHVSFVHQGTLFVGEAAGTFLALDGGDWYLRPATPPRFMLATALASLDRLLALDPIPARLAFAHHGLLEGRTRDLLKRSRQQHEHWMATVRSTVDATPDGDFEEIAARIVAQLRSSDPDFAQGNRLPADIAVREEDFTCQTLRGMVGAAQDEAGHQGASGRDRTHER